MSLLDLRMKYFTASRKMPILCFWPSRGEILNCSRRGQKIISNQTKSVFKTCQTCQTCQTKACLSLFWGCLSVDTISTFIPLASMFHKVLTKPFCHHLIWIRHLRYNIKINHFLAFHIMKSVKAVFCAVSRTVTTSIFSQFSTLLPRLQFTENLLLLLFPSRFKKKIDMVFFWCWNMFP